MHKNTLENSQAGKRNNKISVGPINADPYFMLWNKVQVVITPNLARVHLGLGIGDVHFVALALSEWNP